LPPNKLLCYSKKKVSCR